MNKIENKSSKHLSKLSECIEIFGRDIGFHDIEINFSIVTLFVSAMVIKRVKDDMRKYLASTEFILNHFKTGYNNKLDGHWIVIRYGSYTYVFVDMFKKEIYKQIK